MQVCTAAVRNCLECKERDRLMRHPDVKPNRTIQLLITGLKNVPILATVGGCGGDDAAVVRGRLELQMGWKRS